MGAEKREGHGRIVCESVQHNRVLDRFVEKRIGRWVSEEVPSERNSWEYYAVFGRQGSGHQVSCYLEVSTQEHLWQGAEVAEGPQEALIRCLQRMTGLPASEGQWMSPPTVGKF
ncbi:MAG: hypothetical protein KDD51_10170 [Bdellovibrionales bacterium]|nr:hypothetical protein [Bdellovibrionales bacterium]